MGVVTYELSKVVIGKVENKHHFLYSRDNGNYYEAIPQVEENTTAALIDSQFASIKRRFAKEEVKIICSLQEYVEKEGIYPLFMDANHHYVQTISRGKIQQMKNVIANRDKKFASYIPTIQFLSEYTSALICDELGLNIMIHPLTSVVDTTKVRNVVVPAKKLKLFRDELQRFIYILLLLDGNDILFQDAMGRSLCITSCLRFSGIKETKELLQNEVYVQPSFKDGTVSIKGEMVHPSIAQSPKTYQKLHIHSIK